MKVPTLAVLILLVLGGCAPTVDKALLDANGIKLNSDGSGAMMIGDGQAMMAVGDNVKVPDSFPKDVPLYAGAKVKTAFNMGAATQVALMTPDAAAKVIDFYKSKLAAEGWKLSADVASNDMVSLMLTKGKEQLQILVGPAAGQTTISLTATAED